VLAAVGVAAVVVGGGVFRVERARQGAHALFLSGTRAKQGDGACGYGRFDVSALPFHRRPVSRLFRTGEAHVEIASGDGWPLVCPTMAQAAFGMVHQTLPYV